MVLGWLHVARRPRILAPTALVLALLSIPFLVSYTYRPDSAHLARMIAARKGPHDRLREGDSIWVYRQREPPHAIDVWPPGPDAGSMMRRLVWLWLVGGVFITGYGPFVNAWFRNPRTDAT